DGVPSRHWSADLARLLAGLRPPAHVLAIVPGRDHDARRFVETLAALGLPVRAGAQPPGAASGGIVARAVLLAAARAAVAADEEALAEDEARTGGGPPILVRRVPAQAGLALSAERRIAGAVERRGRVAVCVLPLSRGPDPRPLLPHHSHLLLGAVHGRSWLSATEPAAAAEA
ncbi:MAG TPA: hypothetical protein VNO17_09115, partial [Actinomycetota bacterium]|nr:hypothetical protein [Actinomycetota bacterium]